MTKFHPRVEDPPHTKLVAFESRGEMDCLIKYLMDEYPDQEVKDYAIGLEQPEDYKVVKSLIVRKNEFV